MSSKKQNGPKGSPRIHQAIDLLERNKRLARSDALQLVGYSKAEANSLKRKNNLTVAKRRYRKRFKVQNDIVADRVRSSPRTPPPIQEIRNTSTSQSTISSLSSCDSSLSHRSLFKRRDKETLHGKKLAVNSRRTPSQRMKWLVKKRRVKVEIRGI